jgi:AraC-like DNA-binding protein
MRVSEVSDALGFVNPFHFSRVYRRFHGHAPSLRSHSPDSGATRQRRS